MTNRENAVARADEIDKKIIETVQSGRSFRVEAGAGAGKTYSLKKVIDWLEHEKKSQFKKYGHNVACITYTNTAVDVIAERLSPGSFIKPSTIHTFAWDLIKQFQSTLISFVQELQLLPRKTNDSAELIDITEVKRVNYSLGVRYVENGTLFLFHDDVIKLFVKLLDNTKFRLIISKKFPIILIDEYQDSFRVIMDQFLKFFIDAGVGPQFGLFGDSWQTIYASQGACGLVESDNFVVINKEANFRSQEVIVNALNQIRPDLPQISASDDNDGKITIITTSEYDASRVQKGYYKGELEESVLYKCINDVIEKLEHKWTGETKKLMLTHKMLAKQQGYADILAFLNEHLKNKDDDHFLFFQNTVEPVFKALISNDSKLLFETLGIARRPIESKQNKGQWNELKDKLLKSRQETVGDVLTTVMESHLIGIPTKIEHWMEEGKKGDEGQLYHGKSIVEFYNLQYAEILKAIDFFKSDADYSTNHGVKGEQYDNVFFVLSRGWNDYKFDEQLPLDFSKLSEDDKKVYIRNRNLFYVCCSRPKKNLTILITVPTNQQFKKYLESVFGAENIISYSQFMNMQ